MKSREYYDLRNSGNAVIKVGDLVEYTPPLIDQGDDSQNCVVTVVAILPAASGNMVAIISDRSALIPLERLKKI